MEERYEYRTVIIDEKTWKTFNRKKEILKHCVKNLFNNPKFELSYYYHGRRKPKSWEASTSGGYPYERVSLEDLDIEVETVIEAISSKNLTVNWPFKFECCVHVRDNPHNILPILMKNTWNSLYDIFPSQDREEVKNSIEADLKNIFVRHGKEWKPILHGNTGLNENIKVKKERSK